MASWIYNLGPHKMFPPLPFSPRLNLAGGFSHSCKWNERSLYRGLNRGRGLGSYATFFWDYVRTSKSTRTFEFRTNSVSVSPRRFLKRSRSSSVAIETNTHPAPTAQPRKISGIVCSVEIFGTLAAHVVTIWWLWWTLVSLVPDGQIQGRWTQKWPSKISCGLGSQRPRKRPNSKFPNCGLILTIIGKKFWANFCQLLLKLGRN